MYRLFLFLDGGLMDKLQHTMVWNQPWKWGIIFSLMEGEHRGEVSF